MESQTPPPEGQPSETAQPAPKAPDLPPLPGQGDDAPPAGLRVLAVVLGLIVGFFGAIVFAVWIDVLGTPQVDSADCLAEIASGGDCYGGSGAQKAIGALLGFPGGLIGIAFGVLGIRYAVNGQGSRLVLQTGVAAVVLMGLSLAIG